MMMNTAPIIQSANVAPATPNVELLHGAKRSNPYFVNGPIDAFFIGGLSILAFIIFRLGDGVGLIEGSARTAQVISIGVGVSWVINWPHFAATATRLYSSPHSRRQFPITTWVVPALLTMAAVIAIQNPTQLAPWIVKLFLIWSPYHFSGQTIGITLLYAGRHGFRVSPNLRRLLNWFVFATYFQLEAKTEQVGALSSSFYGISELPTLGIPLWFVGLSTWAVWILGIALATTALREVTASGIRFPWIVAVPLLAQLTWFQLLGDLAAFGEFVPAFHSLQYLYIAWFIQMREWSTSITGNYTAPSRSSLLTRSVSWSVGIFLLGGLMFSWGPYLASLVSGVQLAIVTGVFIATVNIHHFFVDGVIWKLRNPQVKAALSTSFDELMSQARAGP